MYSKAKRAATSAKTFTLDAAGIPQTRQLEIQEGNQRVGCGCLGTNETGTIMFAYSISWPKIFGDLRDSKRDKIWG
jgi:hypothetical protein